MLGRRKKGDTTFAEIEALQESFGREGALCRENKARDDRKGETERQTGNANAVLRLQAQNEYAAGRGCGIQHDNSVCRCLACTITGRWERGRNEEGSLQYLRAAGVCARA